MSLADWERHGWLIPHTTSPQEIADLLALVQRDLSDSRARGVSADWRFNIAYNAALQSAKAALAAAGYRVARGADTHSRTLESLSLTVGLDASSVRRLQAFRKRRNTTEYDHAGVTSEAEAGEVRALAESLLTRVERWLAANLPELSR
jgi:hypothetical protein